MISTVTCICIKHPAPLTPPPPPFHASVTSEEYSLLHRLNQVSIAKYQDMTALATTLNHQSQRLNDRCRIM